jgi:hypothetical protein
MPQGMLSVDGDEDDLAIAVLKLLETILKCKHLCRTYETERGRNEKKNEPWRVWIRRARSGWGLDVGAERYYYKGRLVTVADEAGNNNEKNKPSMAPLMTASHRKSGALCPMRTFPKVLILEMLAQKICNEVLLPKSCRLRRRDSCLEAEV